jgi:hypothetical protein
LIRFVERNECGVIRLDVSKGVRAASLVAQVALAFPDAKVTVIVPDWARGWKKELQRYTPDVGLSTFKNPYWGENRVVVATPGSLGTVPVGEADIVLVAAPLTRMRDDPLLAKVPADLPPPGTFSGINQMEKLADARGRLFALLPRHFRPSRYEAARLAQMFGVAEYVAAGPSLTERPVRVAWEKLTGGSVPGTNEPPLRVKQAAIWSNPVLARRAAALANAIVLGNRETLMTSVPLVAGGFRREGRRVLALVESKDHADVMASRLPGWLVVDAQQPDLPNGRAQRVPGVVATAPGAERLRGDAFDVLVRLDLGAGLPPLPLPGWLDTAEPDPQPMLLIDFDARCHPLLRRWRNSRRSAYLTAGWPDVGQDPDAAALARFIEMTSDRRSRP